jgi:hypothetical protein
VKKWIEAKRVMKFLEREGCADASSSNAYTGRGNCSYGTRRN